MGWRGGDDIRAGFGTVGNVPGSGQARKRPRSSWEGRSARAGRSKSILAGSQAASRFLDSPLFFRGRK